MGEHQYQQLSEKEKQDKMEHQRNKFISLAMLGGIFAILVTMLQIDKDKIEMFINMKIGIIIFAVLFPILILDAFSLNMEEIKGLDGEPETVSEKRVRYFIWILGAAGFVSFFNHLPNVFGISTALVICVSFVIFLLYKISTLTKEEFARNQIKKQRAKAIDNQDKKK